MANFRITTAVRDSLANQLATLVDVGAAGTIKIYTAAQPAGPDTAIGAQTLLATLTFSATAFGAGSVTGVLTASAITDDSSADATGTAVWARIADGNGLAIFDCDVTATGGGGTMEINSTSIVAGGVVRCTAFTITMPAS